MGWTVFDNRNLFVDRIPTTRGVSSRAKSDSYRVNVTFDALRTENFITINQQFSIGVNLDAMVCEILHYAHTWTI